ncbi:MAG: polyprenol monophosphomannose synthase [Phycisphaerae bacterium]|jgi:dolichol-phosphate mannosyltransferase
MYKGSLVLSNGPRVALDSGVRIIGVMPTSPPPASIVVPTYREALNIKPLVERTFAALHAAGREAELIIVDDDSRDGTVEAVAAASEAYPVQVLVRKEERGLSTAVLAGFRRAKNDRFVVLDADLQHPPEMIPTLLDRLDEEGCDFVIGTRYGGAGRIAQDWPVWRRLVSAVATGLARPLVPLSDPMSGFFALHRRTWEQARNVDPIGYKIALELYVKGGCRQPAEVPIEFEKRVAGASKLNMKEQIRYLRHLGRLYRFRFPMLTWILVLVMVLLVAGAVLLVGRILV